MNVLKTHNKMKRMHVEQNACVIKLNDGNNIINS